MAPGPLAGQSASPPRRRRRSPALTWLPLLLAAGLVAAIGRGLWLRRTPGFGESISRPPVAQGAVSLRLTYLARLDRYPLGPNVPAWVQPAYVHLPASFRRLFDAIYGFFAPHFQDPPAGERFLELICTGFAPPGVAPGIGPQDGPQLATSSGSAQLEQVSWHQPGLDGVFRLRILFLAPAGAVPTRLTVALAGQHLALDLTDL